MRVLAATRKATVKITRAQIPLVLAYSLFSAGDNWEFEGPQGKVIVKVTPQLHTNSGDTCRAAALQHQGIIYQPSFLVGGDLRSGALVPLLPGYLSAELGIYAVYPTRKHLSPKVRLLIDFLSESALKLGWVSQLWTRC